jgi:two-component system sensor histidine kinase QseC
MKHSLQSRLLLWVLGVSMATWLLAAAWTWRSAQHELDELLDGHLAQAAALLISQQGSDGHARGEHEHHDDDDEDALDKAPTLHRYAPRVTFQVWHEGQLMTRSANAPTQPLASNTKGFSTVQIDGVSWRVFAAQGRAHDMQVWVGERLDARSEILQAVLRGQFTPLALALPLMALAVWAAVRASLGPLRRLRQAVEAREPQSLQALTLPDAPAELAPLVAALNALFARIASLIEAERRFTADAAHELRTPIAAIRMQAQVAQAASDAPERQRALSATLAGCDRATHLVEQLLTLSRVEASGAGTIGSASTTLSPIDLTALARRVMADAAPAAMVKHQDIELLAPQPCTALGHEALLGVLLRNLLDNAIRYSPEGAAVHVIVEAVNGQPRLVIADSGPGLSDADQARLGERFFRVLGTDQPGSGLGWSIVRRIADLHGLKLEVSRSAALGGLQVSLTWPG